MSDLMDHGVICMPFEMAMCSDLSRWQFYQRAQVVLQERDALRIELRLLRAEVEREREARKAAQIRQAELTDEVVRLEPMRQRADDIKRLTADVERLRADSERMDWLSDVALGMDAVADPDNFTVVFFGTDPCKRAYGRTLRIAVDNAREAK